MSLYKLSAVAFVSAVVVFVGGLFYISHQSGSDSEGVADAIADMFGEGIWVSIVSGVLMLVAISLFIAGWWTNRSADGR